MKHPFNDQVYAYWTERRGGRRAPERSDIDPIAISPALGDSFVLAREDDGSHTFRVAGTRLCGLFDRELTGTSFSGMWDDASAPQSEEIASIVADEAVGVVAGVRAFFRNGEHCDFEIMLLPLRHRGELGARLLGVMAALEQPYWLGALPADPLLLGAIRFITPDAGRGELITSSTPPARKPQRPRLTVIAGGRA